MSKKASILLSFLLFFGAAMAGNVTSEQASRAVSRWLKSNRSLEQNMGNNVQSVRTLSANGTDIHVVRLEGGGFVVTSADTDIEPIICYSSSDDLIEDDRNPLWAMLCHDLPARAKYAQERRRATTRSTSANLSEEERQWTELLRETRLKSGEFETNSRADIRVWPLIASKWGQQSGIFNYYTPSNLPCGCVATALAQVMRYHRYPTQTVEAKTYPCKVSGKDTALTTMGGIYDWDNMPLTVDDNTSEIEAHAIGKLTYDCGIATHMQYEAEGSGTFAWYAVDPLINLFGYANAHLYYSGSGYKSLDMEVVRPLILSNLDAGYPVLMGINGADAHEIVGDGYGFDIITKALYLHVNMGFSGKDDAWYLWPKMSEFSYVADVVYNIMPDKKGQILSGRVTDKNGRAIRDADVVVMATDNDSIIDRTNTNPKGIFSFVLPGGVKYRLTAAYQGKSETILTDELRISVDPKIDYNNWGDLDTTNMQAGNSWGNDIRLADIELGAPDPLVIADTLPAGEEYTLYHQKIAVTGGSAPYYYFIPSNVPYTEDCTEACTFDADRGVAPFNSDEHFTDLTESKELIALPFKFPYFGEFYEMVDVSLWGTIKIGQKGLIIVAGGFFDCKAEEVRIESSPTQVTIQWKDYASITLYSNGKMRVSYGNLSNGGETMLRYGAHCYYFDEKPDTTDYAYANDLVFTPTTIPGFTIDEKTGEVSGFAQQAGSYMFHVNVIDSEGQVVSKDLVIEIKPSPNEKPVISSFAPAQNTLLRKRGTVTHFEMQATDTETAASDLVYRWYLDDKFVGTGNAYDYTATIDNILSIDSKRLHSLTCAVSDEAANNRVSHSWYIYVNADIYIDANYVSDVPENERQGTAEEPFSVFEDICQYGDTIYFRPGTYDVTLTFRIGMKLVSTDGPEYTILKNANGITQLSGYSTSAKTIIEGFTITGPTDNTLLSGGTFVNCRIIDNQLSEDALTKPYIKNAVLKDCIISGNVGAAMTKTKLYNCQVINNENGIDASCEAYNTLFWNNSVCDAEPGAFLENCTFDVAPTGITLIPNSVKKDGDIYDLLGRKVNHITRSGLYLIGNKKQFVKP